MFAHEKFGPYKLAISFVSLITELASTLPRGHGDLLDQLRRAAISIPLNIAEGSGRSSSLEKKRFYSIARGSAMECAAIMDILLEIKLISRESHTACHQVLDSIAAILISICRPTPQTRPIHRGITALAFNSTSSLPI